MAICAFGSSGSEISAFNENTYSIVLHLIEGIGLNRYDGTGDFEERYNNKVVLSAVLNGVRFEVEGCSTEMSTIFNSNCIWECELDDIKRMKTDNRPVKLELSMICSNKREEAHCQKQIGHLLLPLRAIQISNSIRNLQMKFHWHKLCGVHVEWRANKPEICLLLVIVKKELVHSEQMQAMLRKAKNSNAGRPVTPNEPDTQLMLHPQNNVYVELFDSDQLIQVGNNPQIDCEIINVVLALHRLRNLKRLLDLEGDSNQPLDNIVFRYNLLGSVSHREIAIQMNDIYGINERLVLTFKTSLKSLRKYFERIFFIPFNLYLNGIVIANYRLYYNKLLPADELLSTGRPWSVSGSFQFDRLRKLVSARAERPSVDFIFTVDVLGVNPAGYKNKLALDYQNDRNAFSAYNATVDVMGCPLPENNVLALLDNNVEGKVSSMPNVNYQNETSTRMWVQRQHMNSYHSIVMWGRNVKNASITEAGLNKALPVESLVTVEVMASRQYSTNSLCDSPRLAVCNTNALSLFCQSAKATRSVGTGTEDLKCSEQPPKQQSEACVGTDNEGAFDDLAEMKSTAVNTDEFFLAATAFPPAANEDEITVQVEHELEEWKAQQLEIFFSEMKLEEKTLADDLAEKWKLNRAALQVKLDEKITECRQLTGNVENVQTELQRLQQEEEANMPDMIRRHVEQQYATKFQALQLQMEHLEADLQQKRAHFEIQKKATQMEGMEIEQERAELTRQVEELEQILSERQSKLLPVDKLKNVLKNVSPPKKENFEHMEKLKKYYKQQWMVTTSKIHELKLKTLEQQEQNVRDAQSDDYLGNCFKDLFNNSNTDEEKQKASGEDLSGLDCIRKLVLRTVEDIPSCQPENDSATVVRKL